MMNNTAETKNTAPNPAETAALFAAIKSATREEQLVLNGVLLGMATQRSITERAG
jgi:hypothetical protein